MKKIIKKLGVIGLALAVLIPFMDLPKVKAANDDCQYHLQNYLFLDENGLYSGNESGNTILDTYSTNGYQTVTRFPFEFPDNAEIVSVKEIPLSADKISEYVTLHNAAITRDIATSKYQSYKGSNIYGNAFVDSPSGNSNYNTRTILLHGQWKRTNSNFDTEPLENNWTTIDTTKLNLFKNYTLQSTSLASDMNIAITQGKYSQNGSEEQATDEKITVQSLQNLVDDPEKAHDSDNLLMYEQNEKMFFIPISIRRKLTSKTNLENAKFGYVNGGDLVVFGTTSATNESTVEEKIKNTKNSFDSYKAWIKAGGDNKATCKNVTVDSSPACYVAQEGYDEDKFKNDPASVGIDFNVYGLYYWPAILNVEYKTCSTSDDPTAGNWNLKYDANADGNPVSNMPDDANNIALNATVEVAAGPKRDGWTFKQWCTNKNGSGKCVNAGDKITNDKSETVTLFAQWGQTGTTNNGKTGIVSYIISFMAVGAIAGGIYYVSKKKNLFKQI